MVQGRCISSTSQVHNHENTDPLDEPHPGRRRPCPGPGRKAAASPAAPAAEAKPSPRSRRSARPMTRSSASTTRATTKALAARFAEDAEVVEADGARYRGRPLIEQRLAETFAASPGVKLADRGRVDPVPQPGRRQGGRADHGDAGEGRRGDAAAHGAARQARRPLADLEHPRGARAARQPARAAQGPGMDDRRVGRPGLRLPRPGQLPMVGGREFPDPHLHGQGARASR